jgi:hypothetical protein
MQSTTCRIPHKVRDFGLKTVENAWAIFGSFGVV